jgi:thiamine kinase-like enzyme
MGPHNALFTDSGICFIDFEFTGWDEPMRTIVEFTNHQANRGLHPNLRQHFRNYYLSKTNLPEEVTSRWPIDDRLMAIIWLTTQLSRMTPERIAGLQFANPAFEVETHINRSIAKAQERILELENPTLHKQTIDLLA